TGCLKRLRLQGLALLAALALGALPASFGFRCAQTFYDQPHRQQLRVGAIERHRDRQVGNSVVRGGIEGSEQNEGSPLELPQTHTVPAGANDHVRTAGTMSGQIARLGVATVADANVAWAIGEAAKTLAPTAVRQLHLLNPRLGSERATHMHA